MKQFIARENIRRFEERLAECGDPEQRKTLERLLEVERQHLVDALTSKRVEPAIATPAIQRRSS